MTEWITPSHVLMLLAFFLFVMAALRVPSETKLSIGWFGLAAMALAFLL